MGSARAAGVALVNGSLPRDGHTQILRMDALALGHLGIKWRWYQCLDPSTPVSLEPGQQPVRGWTIPIGKNVERGLNRLLPVFARRLRAVEGGLVHVNDVYLARLAAYRDDVVVNVADLSKLSTHFYPRSASAIHNYNLRFVPRCRAVAALSAFTAQDLTKRLRLEPEKVRVVSPFSVTPRSPSPRSAPVHSGSPGDPLRLLYVATDRPHKNLDTFVRILADLGQEYVGVLLADLSERTRRRLEGFGLGQRLEILGGANELGPLYDSADALLHPSLYEGFGLPLLEAMSRGLPVIGSDRTAVPEVVGSGGRTLPPERISLWVDAIRALSDSGTYAEWSKQAWQRAGDFSLERTSNELTALYEAARA